MPRSKRDVNREKMYEKIMPSLARVADVGEIESKTPAAQAPVIKPKTDEFAVVNLTYELVASRAGDVIKRFKCCSCERCKKDVIAIAMNGLSPRYVVSNNQREEVLKYSSQTKVSEVSAALVQAVIKVKAAPRH